MKNKTLSMLSFGMLFVMLFLISVSAIAFTDAVSEISLNPSKLTDNFILKTDTIANFSDCPSDFILEDSSGHQVTFNFICGDLTEVNDVQYNVSASGDTENFNFQESASQSLTFYAENSSNSSENTTKSVQFTFENEDYCEGCENPGNLNIDIEDVDVTGLGDSDEYWYPFDTITVEIDVENSGDWDIEDIEIEWSLYTTDGVEVMDGEVDEINLDEGEEETLTFSFTINDDIEDFENEDVVLYIRAKGLIDDNDSPYDGNESCASESLEVEFKDDEEFVILNDIKINGMEVGESNIFEEYVLNCGEQITITGEAWNIGADDLDDVEIILYNNALNLNEKFEIDEIDAYDDYRFSFTLTVPQEIDETWYTLALRVYDEDKDLFENSEDDESIYNVIFKVEGDKCGFIEPTISAQLLTNAVEDEEMEIKVIVKNQGTKSVDYFINVAGYVEWAELVDISENSFSLDSGESKEIVVKFNTKEESAGERFFDIEIVSDNEIVAKQSVIVAIEETQNKLKDFINDNWKLLIIGLVNLILIIAIIIVAVRTYRK